MPELVIWLVALLLIAAAAASVATRNLLVTAVALGLSSVALATLFFLLGAPYAGGFELSVGAGLISVLFIVAISLVQSRRSEHREE